MAYLEELISAIEFAGELFPDKKPVKAANSSSMKAFFEDFCSHKEYDPLFNPGGVIHNSALRFIQQHPFSKAAKQGHTLTQQYFDQTHNKVFNSGFWVGVTLGDVSINGKPVFNASRDSIREAVQNGVSADSPLDFHVWLTFGNLQILDLTVIPSLLNKKVVKSAEFKDKMIISTKPRKTAKLTYQPILVHNSFFPEQA